MTDFDATVGDPESVPVAVMLRRKPSSNRWLKHSWQIIGLLVGDRPDAPAGQAVAVREGGEETDYLCAGFRLTLYKDEAESYYQNLMAPQPSLYVVTRAGDSDRPEPFLVSASFDEAHAYMEGDDDAHAVAMPAELHPWIERFVLTHYVPEQRKKRKRTDWKKS